MGVVFITGASSGIGEACARAFAERGRSLVLLGRRTERMEALAKELAVPTHLVTVDLRDHAALASACETLPPAFAEVDVLVNNAGLALGMEKATAASLDDWDTMIDTNVTALVHVVRHVLPGMVARNRGHIVNMGSVAGTYPYPGGNVYGATKAFVEQFSLNLRADLAGSRVRVTNLEPGMVETEFSQVRFKGDAEKAASVYRGLEALTAADIAEVVRFCTELPERVNVNRLELMSVAQSFAGFTLDRK